MILSAREQDAVDGLKFCLAHKRRMFRVDVLIVLNIIKKLTKHSKRKAKR